MGTAISYPVLLVLLQERNSQTKSILIGKVMMWDIVLCIFGLGDTSAYRGNAKIAENLKEKWSGRT